jgi:hypothetical protein
MGAFVGESNLDVSKMHGTTIKKLECFFFKKKTKFCGKIMFHRNKNAPVGIQNRTIVTL